ncbi:MAG TPA: RNA polymerase factor sigma-54 [bacterium]|nr:RNA polymerase factor sigma-54 [bacterium]
MRQQFGMNQKMQQRMIMTPMLQQAMKILQMSTMELKDWVEKEMVENPVLEENEETTPDKNTPEEDASPSNTEETVSDPTLEKAREQHDTDLVEHIKDGERFKEETWAMYQESQEYGDAGDSEYGGRQNSEADQEKRDFVEASITRAPSLAEHLEWQFLLVAKNDQEETIGKLIIGNLDDNGYLTTKLEDLAQAQQVTVAEIEKVLSLIQGLEPTGVGARDLRECLLLQLENRTGPVAQRAYQVVLNHFEDMEKRRYPIILKGLECDEEQLREALAYIANLEPKPGRSFEVIDTKYVTPDVSVRKIEGEYVVVLNDEPVPRLRVSPYYRRMLKDKNTVDAKETKKFLETKIQSAIWLIKNIEQRRKTIYRVTEAIFRIQKEFLENGVNSLKPLTLKQVADMIGMHESTISRVTTHKYVQTPRGLFELKYFFTSGLESSDGMDVSSLSVKEKIKEMIDLEPPQKPLSDQKIMQNLTDQGLSIARRTIAKYREELRIPPASQRRKL